MKTANVIILIDQIMYLKHRYRISLLLFPFPLVHDLLCSSILTAPLSSFRHQNSTYCCYAVFAIFFSLPHYTHYSFWLVCNSIIVIVIVIVVVFCVVYCNIDIICCISGLPFKRPCHLWFRHLFRHPSSRLRLWLRLRTFIQWHLMRYYCQGYCKAVWLDGRTDGWMDGWCWRKRHLQKKWKGTMKSLTFRPTLWPLVVRVRGQVKFEKRGKVWEIRPHNHFEIITSLIIATNDDNNNDNRQW